MLPALGAPAPQHSATALGAHTQAESLDQLQINLKEVIELCLEELSADEIAALPEFIGVQQIAVDV